MDYEPYNYRPFTITEKAGMYSKWIIGISLAIILVLIITLTVVFWPKSAIKATPNKYSVFDIDDVTLSTACNSYREALAQKELFKYVKQGTDGFDTDARNTGIPYPFVSYEQSVNIDNLYKDDQTIFFKEGSKIYYNSTVKADLTFDIPKNVQDQSPAWLVPTLDSPKFTSNITWGSNEVLILYQIMPIPEEWTYKENVANQYLKDENPYDSQAKDSIKDLYRYKKIKIRKWIIYNYESEQLDIPLLEPMFYTETNSYMSFFVFIGYNASISDINSRHGIRVNYKPQNSYIIENLNRKTSLSIYDSPYLNYFINNTSMTYTLDWDIVQAQDTRNRELQILKRYVPLSSSKIAIDIISTRSRTFTLYTNTKTDLPVALIKVINNQLVFEKIKFDIVFVNSDNRPPITFQTPDNYIGSVFVMTIFIFPCRDEIVSGKYLYIETKV